MNYIKCQGKPKLEKETIQELLSERDEDDKSALDYSSLLQRLEIVTELIARGVDVNDCSNSGLCVFFRGDRRFRIPDFRIRRFV